ncbi:MAG TPA: PAS domain-containing protein [Bacteroidales bacterium]
MESALKHNKEEYKLRFSNEPFHNFGVWIWYTNENRLLLSEGFYNMIGVSKDVYPTFDLLVGCIHPDDLEGFVNMMEPMLQGSQPRWLRFRVVKSDRSILEIRCYVEVMRTEFADVVDIIGVCFEVI